MFLAQVDHTVQLCHTHDSTSEVCEVNTNIPGQGAMIGRLLPSRAVSRGRVCPRDACKQSTY